MQFQDGYFRSDYWVGWVTFGGYYGANYRNDRCGIRHFNDI